MTPTLPIRHTGMLAVVAGIALLNGCATVHQDLKVGNRYRRQLDLSVNGIEIDGLGVVPPASSYDIEVRSKGQMDLLSILTCSGEWIGEKAGGKGWFQKENKYKHTWVPNELEQSPECHMASFAAYEAKGMQRHGWATFIADRLGDDAIPAEVVCNQQPAEEFNGVSKCQTRSGLLTRIRFAGPVMVTSGKFSGKDPSVNPPEACYFHGKEFEVDSEFTWEMKPGPCPYVFRSLDNKYEHWMLTYGYDDIVIEEDQ